MTLHTPHADTCAIKASARYLSAECNCHARTLTIDDDTTTPPASKLRGRLKALVASLGDVWGLNQPQPGERQ